MFESIQESWIDEDPGKGIFDPLVEAAQLMAVFVETHQRFQADIGIVERLPESAAGERLQDLIRAGDLLSGVLRAANENAFPAGCLTRTGGIERTGDRDV